MVSVYNIVINNSLRGRLLSYSYDCRPTQRTPLSLMTILLSFMHRTKMAFHTYVPRSFQTPDHPFRSSVPQIQMLRISHDNKGGGAAWFLDDVTVDVPSRGEHVVFACHRWFAKDEDDGKLERELHPTEHVQSKASKVQSVLHNMKCGFHSHVR